MPSIEESVHIIPLGHEIDRAVIPFEKTKADRIYLLTSLDNSNSNPEMNDQQIKFAKNVKKRLEKKGIPVSCVNVDLFDLLDVMKTIAKIILLEKENNNRVFVNMSAAGRLTSVAATLVGMVHNVTVYYVPADSYPDKKREKEKHGLSICSTTEVIKLTNFRIVIPESEGLEILLYLCKVGHKVTMEDLVQLLHEKNIKGFEESFATILDKERRRSVQSRQLMKLDKTILTKLEKYEYIKREKVGNYRYITLSESGRYAAHISGCLE